MTTEDLVARIKKHPLGFGCLLVSLICGIVIYFNFGNIESRQTELDQKSAELAKMNANIRNAVNLAEQVSEMQTLSKELDGRLMKAGQLAVNLQYFYKLEAENEVKLIDVRQNSLTRNAKSKYTGIPFSISVQGPYSKIVNFLNRLQNGRHLCRINSASFTKANTGSDSSGTNMTLSLTLELLGTP